MENETHLDSELSDDKIINDFLNGTDLWIKEMDITIPNGECPVCGMIPSNIALLARAIRNKITL